MIRGRVAEIGAHRHGSKQNLRRPVLCGRDTGDLAKEVDPADDPGDGWDPALGCHARDGVVQAAGRWVRGDEFGDAECETETSYPRDEPAPDNGGEAAGVEGVDECGGCGGEETGDGDGEGEGGEVSEFTLEDLDRNIRKRQGFEIN